MPLRDLDSVEPQNAFVAQPCPGAAHDTQPRHAADRLALDDQRALLLIGDHVQSPVCLETAVIRASDAICADVREDGSAADDVEASDARVERVQFAILLDHNARCDLAVCLLY